MSDIYFKKDDFIGYILIIWKAVKIVQKKQYKETLKILNFKGI